MKLRSIVSPNIVPTNILSTNIVSSNIVSSNSVPSTSFVTPIRPHFILGITVLLVATVCMSTTASAQSLAPDQSKNISFIHPPEADAAAVTINKNPLHPAPLPNTGPKVPFKKAPAQVLPQQFPANMRMEDPDNLLRAWKNRRPMEETKRAIQENLAMPHEPLPAGGLPTREQEAKDMANGVSRTLSATGWEQIGSGDFNSDGVHYQAGRIRQATYAYDNSQSATVLWLGATGGGLWKAVDLFFAAVFVPMSDNLPGSPSVGAFLVQPGNSNNILIGTGDIYRYGGTGMYQTTNGGTTWNPVFPSDGTGWPGSFQKVLIDLSDSTNNTVLAQGDSGIWRSTDFGSSWSQVYSGSVTDLVQDPVNTYIWYAGAPGTGVLRSTSSGTSFGAIGSGMATPGRISVAVSGAAPWHVYAIADTTDWKNLSGIWRSDDYGDGTWNLIEGTDHISGANQAFHTTAINVDPNNADIVFAGMAGSQVTYNGTAATPTWTYSSSFDEGHADHTGYTFESGTSNVISTTDGGVYVLDESTLSVSGSLNYATNLNVQQVFGPVGDLACSLNEPDECASGMQDNKSVMFNRNDNPPIWQPLNGNYDGNASSIAPNDANEIFLMANGGRYYSTDDGSSWNGDYGNCLTNNSYATTMIDQTPPNGFTPFIYTFSVPGSGGTSSYVYYKPVDTSCDWSAANASDPFNTNVFSPRTMDASNDPGGYVFYVVGWGSGRLYVLDSYSTGSLGSMTYVDRTPPLSIFSNFSDSQIAADRSSSRPFTVTYTTGSSRPSQAFLSNNRGQTWTEVTGDLATKLPDANYWKLIANPGDQSQLFLGTDQGIYRSDNGGKNWYSYNNGMPTVASIFGLELNYDYASPPLLHVGTYGRGFWDRQVTADAVLSSVSFIPTSIVGGQGAEVVVWLDRPAPKDITVNLTSSNSAVYSVPSTITVSAGYSNAGLIFPTAKVTANTVVTVTGTYNQVSPSANLTVTLAPTATSVTSSLNPSSYGKAVTFTASVTSTYGAPAGNVGFYHGATLMGTSALSGGHATFTTAALPGGANLITAKYVGAGTFAASTSSALTQTVNKDASTTTLTSSHNPSTYGQSVTFTAKVATTAGTPTGTITFKDGATAIGTGTVTAGEATLATTTLAAGTHTITAVYGGSADFNGSTSGAVSQVVDKATSTSGVTGAPNPSAWGATVTFTATILSPTTTPVGTVTFKDGAATLGTGTLSGGKATIATDALAVGAHSITVVYAGNADIIGSTSAVLAHTVNKAGSVASVSGTPNPSEFDQTVVLKATVKSDTTGTPTGTITFKNGAATLGTGTLAAGVASLSLSTLPVGTHAITVVYAGSADFNTSTSLTDNVIVNKAKTTNTLVSSVNPSNGGQSVTFTATIAPAFGGNPTGNVTFKDGATVLGTGAVAAATHKATFTTTKLAAGTHNITAVYPGDADYLTSTSVVLKQVVK
jgi:Big-like domain-containing protein